MSIAAASHHSGNLAGDRLSEILCGQPFEILYEEDKNVGVKNLNPLLRDELCGVKKKYPSIPNATCDVVFEYNGEWIWMETKLLQTHNGGNKETWHFYQRNGNFEKHLGTRFVQGHDSAVRDIRDRLSTLDGRNDANRIGFLAVIYDSPRFPFDGLVNDFIELAELRVCPKSGLVVSRDIRG